MKYRSQTIGLLTLLLSNCSNYDIGRTSSSVDDDGILFATIECVSTKSYVDESFNVLWDTDDRILVRKKNLSGQYVYDGPSGSSSGLFKYYDTGEVISGDELDKIYALYPYSPLNMMDVYENERIRLFLPQIQNYREGSFGLGANTMISVTNGPSLLFRNVCGYLILKLYGDNISISQIVLQGNNDEPLSGDVILTQTIDSSPSNLEFLSYSLPVINLNCNPPVPLGSSAESATEFWIAVPPISFSNGFTLKVIDSNGNPFTKTTSSTNTITRNTTFRMKALKVERIEYQAGTNVYCGTSDYFPDESTILTESVKNSFDVNATITSPYITDSYFWIAVPYGYSINEAAGSYGYLDAESFAKTNMVIENRKYNLFYIFFRIPSNNRYEISFIKDI